MVYLNVLQVNTNLAQISMITRRMLSKTCLLKIKPSTSMMKSTDSLLKTKTDSKKTFKNHKPNQTNNNLSSTTPITPPEPNKQFSKNSTPTQVQKLKSTCNLTCNHSSTKFPTQILIQILIFGTIMSIKYLLLF